MLYKNHYNILATEFIICKSSLNTEEERMNKVARFAVSIDERLLNQFDELITQKGYINRSEAVRDLIRDMLEEQSLADKNSFCFGTLTVVYNHHVSELSDKLNDIQHDFFENIVSTTHIHVDQHNCLEVLILKGTQSVIKELADRIMAIKGVTNGKLMVTKPTL